MSQFSATDFDAKAYFNHRPTYPDSFYDLIDRFHQGPRKLAVDVGCGPGVATFQLSARLNSFDKIIGTDVSSTMVKRARSWINDDPDKFTRVSFEVSPAESFEFLPTDQINKKSLDLITAVECVHWFDFDKFQRAAASNLRKGGTFAMWGYSDAFFPEYPKIDSLIINLTYDENNGLGKYWDQPGHSILRNMYKDLHLDTNLFTDIEEAFFMEDEIRSKEHVKSEPVPFFMSKFVTLSQYQEFIKTWSGYHTWRQLHPNAEKDITDEFVDRILEIYPELSRSSRVQVCWRSFYKFARAL
ncbi:hypothetical protein ZYGR_0H03430 [Zygosaccharomyces rouxii]|uniref:ZYRO0B11946p n=2 Tax=Zygosaccharomyces rouxii TaxID=4956 RepID=C5DRW8_ZYGRC|nr:uncharacterized protein ZYRO0B11946g [Zygosaccharomyces rouxii]KAH9199941.1 S-adenosyl-L-methionine-dependent methyltransferase [Zygosaccharomyces rouxii]GAV47499.1 hypothetical protein ZYGR_0H03430 [Zygosaccharomyces rouxii]CAR26529.1 ZYRO0B11946p [Zygosaccharomyces rouxii]